MMEGGYPLRCSPSSRPAASRRGGHGCGCRSPGEGGGCCCRRCGAAHEACLRASTSSARASPGLAAALCAARAGTPVSLYEAAPSAGGRCRTVSRPDGFSHDNGTPRAARRETRARWRRAREASAPATRWVEPEPAGLPRLRRRDRAARPCRPPPARLAAAVAAGPRGSASPTCPRLARLTLGPSATGAIGRIFAGAAAARELHRAADGRRWLNTPVEIASAAAGSVGRCAASPPPGRRASVRSRARARAPTSSTRRSRRSSGLENARSPSGRTPARGRRQGRAAHARSPFAEGSVALGPDDGVAGSRLPARRDRPAVFPRSRSPDAYEPIVNAHYRVDGPARPRLRRAARGAVALGAGAARPRLRHGLGRGRVRLERSWKALAARIWEEVGPCARRAECRLANFRGASGGERRGGHDPPGGRGRTLPRPIAPEATLRFAGDWPVAASGHDPRRPTIAREAAADLLPGVRARRPAPRALDPVRSAAIAGARPHRHISPAPRGYLRRCGSRHAKRWRNARAATDRPV